MIGLTLHDTDASTDRNISVVQNWNLFGYSSATPINITEINFTNSTANVNWSTAVSQGKVLAYFMYRDNNVYRYAATPDFYMQDYALRQNRSYWVKINQVGGGNLTLLGVGGSLVGRSYEWNKLRFTNGSDEKNITDAGDANWTFADGDPWADYIIYYEDGYPMKVCDNLLAPDNCDTDTLDPWSKGYWIWVNNNNVQLLRRN